MVNPRKAVSTAWPSAVMLMRAPGAGTRFTQTRILIDFMRESSGSNSGVAPARSTVTGYSSFMYMTCSLVPSTACSRREVGEQQVLADATGRRRRW